METTDRLLAPAGYLFVLAHNAPADIAKIRLNVCIAVDWADLCHHEFHSRPSLFQLSSSD
jgi:hypothetical protein